MDMPAHHILHVSPDAQIEKQHEDTKTQLNISCITYIMTKRINLRDRDSYRFPMDFMKMIVLDVFVLDAYLVTGVVARILVIF